MAPDEDCEGLKYIQTRYLALSLSGRFVKVKATEVLGRTPAHEVVEHDALEGHEVLGLICRPPHRTFNIRAIHKP